MIELQDVLDMADISNNNGWLEVNLKFDWKTYNIAHDDYFFKKNNPSHQYADYIDKALEAIYSKVAEKCTESGEYTIDCWKGRYTVRKIDEIEQIHYEAMTDEEKEAYDMQKAQNVINEKRAERDNLLVTVVDPVVTNPLRWDELSDKEKEKYKAYRLYLLDIPQQEDFPNIDILSFDDFKA